MAKVFILNSAGHDFRAAEKYGEFRVVTMGNVNIFNLDRLRAEMGEILKEMQDGDFLLTSGTPALAALAINYLSKETQVGSINLLLWSPKRREYVPRWLDIR